MISAGSGSGWGRSAGELGEGAFGLGEPDRRAVSASSASRTARSSPASRAAPRASRAWRSTRAAGPRCPRHGLGLPGWYDATSASSAPRSACSTRRSRASTRSTLAAGHVPGLLPSLLDRAQRRFGRAQVGDRQQRLGLGQQGLLGARLAALARRARPRPRCGRRRTRPGRRGSAAHSAPRPRVRRGRRPSTRPSARGSAAVAPQSVEAAKRLGLGDDPLLAGGHLGALRRGGEVGLPLVERRAGGAEAAPQLSSRLRSMRGAAFHASTSSRSRSPLAFHRSLSASDSASATMASLVASPRRGPPRGGVGLGPAGVDDRLSASRRSSRASRSPTAAPRRPWRAGA